MTLDPVAVLHLKGALTHRFAMVVRQGLHPCTRPGVALPPWTPRRGAPRTPDRRRLTG